MSLDTTIKELRSSQKTHYNNMQDILKKAETEKRSLTDEEKRNWDRAFEIHASLDDDIKRYEKMEKLDELRSSFDNDREERAKRLFDDSGDKKEEKRSSEIDKKYSKLPKYIQNTTTEEYRNAWSAYAQGGKSRLNRDEYRALQQDVDASGGYTTVPYELANEIARLMWNLTFMRKICKVHPLFKAANLGVPTVPTDIADSDWTTELLTGTADTSLTFGRKDLHPEVLVKTIDVSEKLLELSAFDVEGIVREQLAAKFSITEEKGFMTGAGTGQLPLGVFTASAGGISTGRDVSNGNTATAMTYDGLTNAIYNIPAQYRNDASFAGVFHRDGIKQIMTIKDTTNRPIYVINATKGAPSTILGYDTYESEYAPNVFTTGQYVGIFGAFRYYNIAEVIGYKVRRLDELKALTNQVVFKALKYVDGQPIYELPFTRVKLA